MTRPPSRRPRPSPRPRSPQRRSPSPSRRRPRRRRRPATAPAAAANKAKLKALVASATGIEIEADGPIDNVDSFLLTNPDRVVVDVFGAKSGISRAKQSFAEGVVSQARIGEHADKVRVVLDLRAKTGKPTVVPTEKGVRIELTSDGATANGPDAAMAPPAAADKAEAACRRCAGSRARGRSRCSARRTASPTCRASTSSRCRAWTAWS